MKKISRIVIAIIVAIILFFVLYAQINQAKETDVFVDVVVVNKDILPDSKISKEDLEIKKMPEELANDYFNDLNEVENRYSKDRIYAFSMVHRNNVKTTQSEKSENQSEVREIRVLTDVASYSGVGPGDRVDLIYVNRLGAIETVGKVLYEGLEVRAVLNRSGINLEQIIKDKYNEVNMEPRFVVFHVDQKMALEIETLQGISNDVVFNLAKWTPGSEKLNENHGVQTEKTILEVKNAINETSKTSEDNLKIGDEGGDDK